MQDIALLTDTDKNKNENDVVSLMTIHASKGLEFPYVYIVGMEENLFPSQLSINSRTELEEERRLFYVALTRAEIKATLSFSTTRYRWGNLTYAEPSRFLQELDVQYIDQIEEKKSKSNSSFDFVKEAKNTGLNERSSTLNFKKTQNLKRVVNSSSTPSTFEGTDLSGLKKGDQVIHQRFGKGTVLELEGNSPNKKATVNFEEVGSKSLLLKFAKLQIL